MEMALDMDRQCLLSSSAIHPEEAIFGALRSRNCRAQERYM
jgi:hypothetical protein